MSWSMALSPDLGVNETTAFMFALWGGADLGKNQNFPSGPSTQLPGTPFATVDEFWKQYFRYFLHYQAIGSPPLKMLRIAVGFDFGDEGTYLDWKTNPAAYWSVFDSMVKWAEAAGVELIPVVMHCSQNTATSWPANRYMAEPARTAHLVEFTRALMARYESSKAIVMWDLLNEPAPAAGSASAFGGWLANLIAQVRSATAKPITMGFDNEFVFSQSELTTLMASLDVWQSHIYVDGAMLASIPTFASWAKAAAKPWFWGELGTNKNTGYFNAVSRAWVATGNPACAMALWNGLIDGAYADFPYTGLLPDYATAPPPPPPPPPLPSDLQPQLDALVARMTAVEGAMKDVQAAIAAHVILKETAHPHRHLPSATKSGLPVAP